MTFSLIVIQSSNEYCIREIFCQFFQDLNYLRENIKLKISP